MEGSELIRRTLLAFTLILPLARPRAEAGDPLRDHVDRAYTAWAESSGRLGAVLAAVAAGGPAADLTAAREAFAAAFLAWQRLWPLGAGPAVAGETPSRVQFWPDRHGTAGRQLAQALAERRPALLTPAGLAAGSVALQSLAALEVLLFGKAGPLEQGGEEGGFARGYAASIGALQAEIAREAAEAWRLTPPDPDPLRDSVLAGMRDTLDIVVQQKLERPLGEAPATARGQRAEAWRSGLSLPAIRANLEAVRDAYRAGFAASLASGVEGAALDAMAQGRLEAAIAAVDSVPLPLHEAVADPTARARVETLLAEAKGLRGLVVERLAPALGVPLGFNAMDGD